MVRDLTYLELSHIWCIP